MANPNDAAQRAAEERARKRELERAAAEREYQEILSETADLEGEAAKAAMARVTSARALDKVNQDIADGYREDILNPMEKALAVSREAVKSAREQEGVMRDQIETLKTKLLIETDPVRLASITAELAAAEKILVIQNAITDAARKYNAEIEKSKVVSEKAGGVAGDILVKTLGISDAWENSNVGQFMDIVEAVGFGGALNAVGVELTNMLTPANILGSTMMMTYEATVAMVYATDDAISSFKKATGAGEAYDDVLMQATIDSRQFSAGMKEASEAMQTLFTDMSGFTDLSKDAQAETTAFTTGMEKLGVAGSDTAEIMDHAMKGWGMSLGEAQGVSEELLATATALQVPPGQIAKDFNMAMKELGKYGPEGVEVFKGLAAQAKASGMEVSSLLSIAGKFDTIEGAAGAVGELNAILGVNMNTMEMLNATEEERITLLQKSVAESGKSWSAMDRFEKQAVAQAAGISDMSEANMLFGQSLDVYGNAIDAAEGATAAQANMAEMAEAATSIQEKLSLIMERMAVLIMPIITAIRWLANAMLAVMDAVYEAGKAIEDFGDDLGIIGAPIQLVGWLIKELSGPIGFMGVAFGLMFLVNVIWGSYLPALGTAITEMWIWLQLYWEEAVRIAGKILLGLKEAALIVWRTALKWLEWAADKALAAAGFVLGLLGVAKIERTARQIALSAWETLQIWYLIAAEWARVQVENIAAGIGIVRGLIKERGIQLAAQEIALRIKQTVVEWYGNVVAWAQLHIESLRNALANRSIATRIKEIALKVKEIALRVWSTLTKWAEIAAEWAGTAVGTVRELIRTRGIAGAIKEIGLRMWSTALRWADTAAEWAGIAVGWVKSALKTTEIAQENASIATRIISTAGKWLAVAADWALVIAKGVLVGMMVIATIATWAFNAALYANPVGLVVLAVVALIAVLFFFPEIIDLIVAGFTWLWDIMIAYYTFLWDVFVGVWSFLYDAILMVPDAIVYLWDTFVGFFTEAGSWMDWLLGIGVFFAPFIAIPLLIIRNWDLIMDFFAGLWDNIVGMFNSAVDIIVGLFTDPVNTIMGVWDGILGFFTNMWDGIKELFTKAADFITGILKSPINIIIETVNWMISKLNTISFGPLPDWIPFIGGKEFGLNIPLIPKLEEGGMVTEGGIAEVHKGEVVLNADQAAQIETSKVEMQQQQSDLLDRLEEIIESATAPKKGGLLSGIMDAAGAIFDPFGLGEMLFGGGEEEEPEMVTILAAIEKNTAAISALAGVQGAAEGGGGGKTIVLQLDGRELGRAVTNSLNEQNNLSIG